MPVPSTNATTHTHTHTHVSICRSCLAATEVQEHRSSSPDARLRFGAVLCEDVGAIGAHGGAQSRRLLYAPKDGLQEEPQEEQLQVCYYTINTIQNKNQTEPNITTYRCACHLAGKPTGRQCVLLAIRGMVRSIAIILLTAKEHYDQCQYQRHV